MISGRLRAVTLGLATLTLVLTPATGAVAKEGDGKDGAGLAQVRQATVAYHDLTSAVADGFAPLLDCIDAPGVGGMGQHYGRTNADGSFALDGTVDPLLPEALVYEPGRRGTYRLVAVEYIVPQALWGGPEPPELFGQHFHANDALGIWALHAWIWRGNPDGVHADFNPTVRLCP